MAASVTVFDQNAVRVVLLGAVTENPELDEKWTITVSAIANDPGLLAQKRDELLARMYAKQDAWVAAQAAIADL
jgi:hypothetical protein